MATFDLKFAEKMLVELSKMQEEKLGVSGRYSVVTKDDAIKLFEEAIRVLCGKTKKRDAINISERLTNDLESVKSSACSLFFIGRKNTLLSANTPFYISELFGSHPSEIFAEICNKFFSYLTDEQKNFIAYDLID